MVWSVYFAGEGEQLFRLFYVFDTTFADFFILVILLAIIYISNF